jgi:hypothetical protein
MRGAASLGGLVYQQNYITLRVLCGLGEQVMDPTREGFTIVEFAIEGRTNGDAPAYDIDRCAISTIFNYEPNARGALSNPEDGSARPIDEPRSRLVSAGRP